jgi:hypothetical protein
MLVASLLGGCSIDGLATATHSSATSISNEDYAIQYDYHDIRAATEGRNFPVFVAGNPFPGLADADFSLRLMPVLQASTPQSWPTFALAREAEPRTSDYQLTLLFDPAQDLTAARVCGGETRVRPASYHRVVVFAVVCRGKVPLAQAIGKATANTPEDRSFAQLFKELLAVVYSNAPIIPPYYGYPGGLL